MSPGIRFHNSLTNRVERFEPIEPGQVRLYVCGPTTNNEPHVGHGRSYVVFDVLRRYLESCGYHVRHVQNFTDVEEAVAVNAARSGMEMIPYANRIITMYNDEMAHLNVLPPHHQPRVSEYIDRIIDATGRLEAAGCAYPIDDALVYDTSGLDDFGAMMGGNLERHFADDPADVDLAGRKDPLDFVLWRNRDDAGFMYESPWGEGRPGWHTECAVMATHLLGPTIDIHGGGLDLIFPHHECERAIARGLTGQPFARFFIHNGFVTQSAEKMSKSLGNYLFLRDARREWSAPVLRRAFLSRHYRDNVDWDAAQLGECQAAVEGLAENIARFEDDEPNSGPAPAECSRFYAALANDLGTHDALDALEHCAARCADERPNMDDEERRSTRLFIEDALYILGFEGIAPWNR